MLPIVRWRVQVLRTTDFAVPESGTVVHLHRAEVALVAVVVGPAGSFEASVVKVEGFEDAAGCVLE